MSSTKVRKKNLIFIQDLLDLFVSVVKNDRIMKNSTYLKTLTQASLIRQLLKDKGSLTQAQIKRELPFNHLNQAINLLLKNKLVDKTNNSYSLHRLTSK